MVLNGVLFPDYCHWIQALNSSQPVICGPQVVSSVLVDLLYNKDLTILCYTEDPPNLDLVYISGQSYVEVIVHHDTLYHILYKTYSPCFLSLIKQGDGQTW